MHLGGGLHRGGTVPDPDRIPRQRGKVINLTQSGALGFEGNRLVAWLDPRPSTPGCGNPDYLK